MVGNRGPALALLLVIAAQSAGSVAAESQRLSTTFDRDLLKSRQFRSFYDPSTLDINADGFRFVWAGTRAPFPHAKWESTFGLRGDFETTLWFKANHLGVPQGGWGNGVMLRIDFLDRRHSGVSIHRIAKATGEQVVVIDNTRDRNQTHDIQEFPAAPNTSALVASREGGSLHVFQVVDATQHLLATIDVPADVTSTVSVHVHSGGAVAELDVTLAQWDIQTAEAVSPVEMKRTLDVVKFGAAVAMICLLVGGVFGRSRADAAPPQAQPRPFFGFSLRDCLIGWCIAVAFFAIANYRKQHPEPSRWLRPDLSTQIGAEYDTIAQSIRKGHGFGNVFHEQTGPTAWMPPVLPYLTAGLYWLNNDHREAVIESIVTITLLVMAFSATIVMSQARQLGFPAWAAGTLLVAGMFADFFELFQRTHDTWLVLLCLNITYLGTIRWWRTPPSLTVAAGWGIWGGFCALCGPICGLVWAASTAISWRPQRLRHAPGGFSRVQAWLSPARPLLAAALVSMLIVAPWIIRTRMALGKWTPIKSNGVYEIWQSQVLDDDGVLDSDSAFQHPWGSKNEQRARYVEVGEIAFIGELWEPTAASIYGDPLEFAQRIANRWWAACVYYQPLVAADENLVWPIRYKRAYFAIPFLSLVIVVLLRREHWPPPLAVAVSVYALGLTPYILISYYDRYAAPLVVAKLVILLYALDTIRLPRRALQSASAAAERHQPAFESHDAIGPASTEPASPSAQHVLTRSEA